MRRIFSLLLFSSLALHLTSCSSANLYVRSEYYSRQNLASYAVDTPDPRKDSSDFGQRLVIGWSMTESVFQSAPSELVLRVKLKNGEEKVSKIVLTKRQGRTFYPIFGNDYTKKGGLQSYLVQLESGGKVLTSSKHKLWVQKINGPAE